MLKHDIDYSNRKTWSYKFRKKRMELFFDFIDRNFKDKKIRILDVGGSRKFWETFFGSDRQENMEITVINKDLPTFGKSYVNRQGARLAADSVHLLCRKDLALLFPGLMIQKEKILFLTKSYIVYGNCTDWQSKH